MKEIYSIHTKYTGTVSELTKNPEKIMKGSKNNGCSAVAVPAYLQLEKVAIREAVHLSLLYQGTFRLQLQCWRLELQQQQKSEMP